MNAFLSQFGVDWKLFLSQLINFALILIILRAFVYKPLVTILNKRRDRIAEGLAKAKEADIRLKEVDLMSKHKIQEVENKCVEMLTSADIQRKKKELEIAQALKKKEEELLRQAETAAKAHEKELKNQIQKEASLLIKNAIAKGIDSEPDQIDQSLIKKTASILENEL